MENWIPFAAITPVSRTREVMLAVLYQSTAYGWLMLAGLCLSLFFWSRLARRDPRLLYIYFAALGGAFFGAKLVYLAAEGWLHWHDPNRWLQLATGKTVIGGLLGGYVGVEIAKRALGYNSATGDWFALITPVTIILGRIGCWFHGCCRGIRCSESWYTLRDSDGFARWPSVQVEILFNAVALCAVLYLRKRRLLPAQHFHLYLMGYGVFRFFHEFLREEPRLLGPITGYQVAALAVLALGIIGFVKRQKGLPRPIRFIIPEPASTCIPNHQNTQ
jgi:phosphatidylglycerol:prolipoprotein diacylglycerol transferase